MITHPTLPLLFDHLRRIVGYTLEKALKESRSATLAESGFLRIGGAIQGLQRMVESLQNTVRGQN